MGVMSDTKAPDVVVRTSDDVPVVVRVEQAHGSMMQNLGAIAGIAAFVLTDHISGELGVGAIMAIVGVIAWPGLKKGGSAGMVGSLGVFTAIGHMLLTHRVFIPALAVISASLFGGCISLPDARNTLNQMQVEGDRVGAAVSALCPVAMPVSDPHYVTCRDGKEAFNKLAAHASTLQDAIDKAL